MNENTTNNKVGADVFAALLPGGYTFGAKYNTLLYNSAFCYLGFRAVLATSISVLSFPNRKYKPMYSRWFYSMDVITLGYAVVVAAGGIAGYMKAGSTASLTAGLVFGGIIALGTYFSSAGQQLIGQILVIGAASTLTYVMGKRYMNSGKVFPAGVVTMLSVLILLRFAYYKFLHWFMVNNISWSTLNIQSGEQQVSDIFYCCCAK